MRKTNKTMLQAGPAVAEGMTLQDFLDEAELCCEHARVAGRQRRFKAACGLFATAKALYSNALANADRQGSQGSSTIEERLRHVELEMSAYTELARSMARPLLRRTGSVLPTCSSGQPPA
jgi:hypothetical protein